MASPPQTSGVVTLLAEPVISPSPIPSNRTLATTQSSQTKGKKRPASPANSSSPASISGNNSKKKRLSFSANMIEPPPQPPQVRPLVRPFHVRFSCVRYPLRFLHPERCWRFSVVEVLADANPRETVKLS